MKFSFKVFGIFGKPTRLTDAQNISELISGYVRQTKHYLLEL